MGSHDGSGCSDGGDVMCRFSTYFVMRQKIVIFVLWSPCSAVDGCRCVSTSTACRSPGGAHESGLPKEEYFRSCAEYFMSREGGEAPLDEASPGSRVPVLPSLSVFEKICRQRYRSGMACVAQKGVGMYTGRRVKTWLDTFIEMLFTTSRTSGRSSFRVFTPPCDTSFAVNSHFFSEKSAVTIGPPCWYDAPEPPPPPPPARAPAGPSAAAAAVVPPAGPVAAATPPPPFCPPPPAADVCALVVLAELAEVVPASTLLPTMICVGGADSGTAPLTLPPLPPPLPPVGCGSVGGPAGAGCGIGKSRSAASGVKGDTGQPPLGNAAPDCEPDAPALLLPPPPPPPRNRRPCPPGRSASSARRRCPPAAPRRRPRRRPPTPHTRPPRPPREPSAPPPTQPPPSSRRGASPEGSRPLQPPLPPHTQCAEALPPCPRPRSAPPTRRTSRRHFLLLPLPHPCRRSGTQ
eukprot:Rhum_TRINITY_DN14618_c45_g1::Rhum_TRINITY_DN14618_c45_g1_i1::g.106168::m.106168